MTGVTTDVSCDNSHALPEVQAHPDVAELSVSLDFGWGDLVSRYLPGLIYSEDGFAPRTAIGSTPCHIGEVDIAVAISEPVISNQLTTQAMKCCWSLIFQRQTPILLKLSRGGQSVQAEIEPDAVDYRQWKAMVAGLALWLVACGPLPAIDNAPPDMPPEPVVYADVWRPAPGTTWQWQLSGALDTSFAVDMYNVDLFDTPRSTIDALHAAGHVVICYFSAGTLESWRPDADLFPADLVGNKSSWPREQWLDIRAVDRLAPIITARLDLAVEKDCDGVEPDNVDAYINDSGFTLSSTDQLRFNRFLANEAHRHRLSVGLKNDVDQSQALEPYFDWVLNERCYELGECALLAPFIAAGKAVFGVEYTGDPARICPEMNRLNYDWLFKNIQLDNQRLACR